jgi:hypothetical protein
MPISEIQDKVLRCIAANRSPESYLAGATVLHRGKHSPRYSQDLDFFHDIEDSVALCARKDAETLQDAGYDVAWLLRTPTFHRAVVSAGNQQIKIEWAQDTAFRFFPVQQDDQCGYRLHDADAAINKVLALAGRDEVRDFVDVIHMHRSYLSLGALAWAACGKDPGFTPEFLLDHAGRHTVYHQKDLDRLSLTEPVEIGRLKTEWLAAAEAARGLVVGLPPEDVGCLYLDAVGNPVTPEPSSRAFATLIRHWGAVHGVWPAVSPYQPDSANA